MIHYFDIMYFMILVNSLCLIFFGYQITKLWIEIKAFKNSTHQVTYINPLAKVDPASDFEPLTDKLKQKLQENIEEIEALS